MISWRPCSEMVTMKVHTTRFVGEIGTGAPITPGCPEPKKENEWFFSLVDYGWKRKMQGGKRVTDDPAELDIKYSKSTVADVHKAEVRQLAD